MSIYVLPVRQALILITCTLERSKQPWKGFSRLGCERLPAPGHIPAQERSSVLSCASTTPALTPPLAKSADLWHLRETAAGQKAQRAQMLPLAPRREGTSTP